MSHHRNIPINLLLTLIISCHLFLSYSLTLNGNTNVSNTFSRSPTPLCLPHQSHALLKLKKEFGHENEVVSRDRPKIMETWNATSRDCCSWEGVVCDARTGHITSLDLSDGGIVGPLSPNSSLFDLLHLRQLNLAYNNFSYSAIPPSVARLARLTHLNLSYSALSGVIPPEISWLTKLISLDLSTHKKYKHPALEVNLTRLSFQNMTRLRVLCLDQVKSLSTVLPKSMVNLSSLVSLSLSGYNVYDEFPNFIFQLPNIQEINMSGHRFVNPVSLPEFESSSKLKSLDLSDSYFIQKLPNSIGNLKSLAVLSLSGCGFSSGGIPASIGNLSQLQRLDLLGNYFDGQIPSTLGNLKKLVVLSLSLDRLSGEFPHSLVNLTNLEELYLSGNNFSNQILSSVTNLQNLKILQLSGNNFNRGIPNSFGNLVRLEDLYLSGNSLSGQIPISFGNLVQLKELHLSFNSLSGQIPNFFGNLVQLEELDLSFNSFSGQIPNSFGNLVQLKELDLSYNSFSGQIPNSFGNLVQLKELDLSYNSIGGLPYSFGNLVLLERLHISHTSLGNRIPQSIGNLTSLKQLNLFENGFGGEIPSLLGNLTQLDTLDLSWNSFTGQIPDSLGNLKELEDLDLSYNNLGGQIPSSLGNLRQLTSLQLACNSFRKFPISLSNLTQLNDLDLSHNQLTELSDPSNALEKFATLGWLSLTNNSIAGVIPSSLLRMPNLNTLDLDHNQLTGLDTHNISSSRLASLSLANNKLSIELSIFSDLTHLTLLDLSNNNGSLSVDQVEQYPNTSSPKLDFLNLSSCGIRRFPNILKSQEKLRILDLSSNKIEGEIPEWFWTNVGTNTLFKLKLSHNFISGWGKAQPLTIPWATLEILELRDNNLTGKVDPLLCRTKLRVIDLSMNRLNGTFPQCLVHSNGFLRVLNLQGNDLRGNLSNAHFTYPFNILSVLDLSHNHLQGSVPQSLIECEFLEILNLGHNKLSGEFPFGLQNLSFLSVLILRSNKLHGPIWLPHNFSGFVALKILDLSFNHFCGILPPDYFQNWTAMTEGFDDWVPVYNFNMKSTGDYDNYEEPLTLTNKGGEVVYPKILSRLMCIDLSNNRFRGEIPSSIVSLRSLIVLSLSSNNFSGLIPSSLGELIRLESLDLSNNKLSGGIPQQLTKLTFLQYLNLSQNQLTGPIPQQRQFGTFLNSSFEGNLGLCGFPLSKKCETPEPPLSPRHSEGSESENGFGWKPVAMGYGCGLIIGVVAGYIIISRRPYWFVRTFGVYLRI